MNWVVDVSLKKALTQKRAVITCTSEMNKLDLVNRDQYHTIDSTHCVLYISYVTTWENLFENQGMLS